jgi:hypothetical protein
MIRSKQYALVLTTLAVAAATALPARRAAAQDQAAIDKLVQMNKRALEDYDTLEWDSAKRTLLDALMTGKKAGLDNHPVMARTYVHLGAVYITGFKNREKAIQSFIRALEIDPSIQLTKGIASAEVNDAFAEAQRKSGGGGASAGGGDESRPPPSKRRRGPVMEEEGGGAPPPSGRRSRRSRESDDEESGEPDLPIRINALDCPEPDEAILEKPVILRCALSPKLPATKVFLLYRAPGKEDYTEVEMTKTPKGWFQGKIPKKAVVGKSIQFYFEGRNDDGKTVVANGGHDSPNIMLIVESAAAAKAVGEAGEGEEENPLDEDGRPKKPKIYLGHRDTSNEGLDIRFGKRKFWIGLGFGSGYGYAKGNGLEAVNQSLDVGSGCNSNMPGFHCLQSAFQPGLAWAGWFQVEPEFGYQFTPNLALALTGRLQYIYQPSKYAHYGATGAISGLLKLIYYTQQSQVRFFGAAIVGGGEGARFVVYPAEGSGAPYSDFQDTVRAGPVLAGLGGGLYFEMSKAVSLVLEIDGLAGFPQFGFVGDGILGLQINFYGSGPTHNSLTDRE